MEGKKRDRPPFFNQVFSRLVDDYKNNSGPELIFNLLKAFKQLEAAQVDPSLLAYSIILNKDPDNYQSYTPQHKIGKSLNIESGGLIKFYKTGHQEDGYKGYSTNYQDLNIDIYKAELWRLLRDILMLLDCDIQKLEDQIFPPEIGDDYVRAPDIIYINRANKKNDISIYKKTNKIQSNESLDKYESQAQIHLVSGFPSALINCLIYNKNRFYTINKMDI